MNEPQTQNLSDEMLVAYMDKIINQLHLFGFGLNNTITRNKKCNFHSNLNQMDKRIESLK